MLADVHFVEAAEVHGDGAALFTRHIDMPIGVLQVTTEAAGANLFCNHPFSVTEVWLAKYDAPTDQREYLSFAMSTQWL